MWLRRGLAAVPRVGDSVAEARAAPPTSLITTAADATLERLAEAKWRSENHNLCKLCEVGVRRSAQ